MKVFRGLPSVESRLHCAPCVLTIGNFDGVHLAHQALLKRLRDIAAAQNLAVSVMTFQPHPREFFNPEKAPPRIALLRDKLEAFRRYGVDRVIVMHFNEHFAMQSPDIFIQKIIVKGLHAQSILVGDDFHYGAKREGNFSTLQKAGSKYQFDVKNLETIEDKTGNRISSSAVRDLLAKGQFDKVQTMLGRAYAISGHVVHGNKLGAKLGFPTINIRIPYRRFVLNGIFTVRVYGLSENNEPLAGVASLGIRPTVANTDQIVLEVHLLNWQGNGYGRLVSVEFLKKLRDEERYDNLTLLIDAIQNDVQNARAYFRTFLKR